MNHTTGCLVCGRDLTYLQSPEQRECYYCHEVAETAAVCAEGHYVCDRCHGLSAEELIERFCRTTELRDPLAIACTLMKNPAIKMHGPEHHFLVPASLLAAYYNTRGDYAAKEAKITQARKRAEMIKGGSCGVLGTCGAAMGTGIFISLITDATPFSEKAWSLSNQMTARSLSVIAKHGGPRCCKRDSWLAIREAVSFLFENCGITLPIEEKTVCTFSEINRECRGIRCPFNPEYSPGA